MSVSLRRFLEWTAESQQSCPDYDLFSLYDVSLSLLFLYYHHGRIARGNRKKTTTSHAVPHYLGYEHEADGQLDAENMKDTD